MTNTLVSVDASYNLPALVHVLDGNLPSTSNAAAMLTKVNTADWTKVSVRTFGAVGDGVTDDTNAELAAIAHAKTLVRGSAFTKQQDGAVVYYPKGLYLTRPGELIVDESDVAVEGESYSSSVIYCPDATANVLTFDNPSFALYHCGIKNIRISTPGNATAGFHLAVKHAIYFMLNDVELNGWFGGLNIGGCAKMFNTNLILSQEVRDPATTATGPAIDMTCEYTYSSDIHFVNLQIMEDSATAGVDSFIVRGVDGLYVMNSHMHGTFLVNPSNTGNEVVISTIVMDDMYFDGSRDVNLIFSGTASAAYKDIRISNSYVRAGVAGVRFATTSTVSGVQFNNTRIAQCVQNGFEITNHNVNGMSLDNMRFEDNNSGNSASYGDMYLNGNDVSVGRTQHVGGGAAGFGIQTDAASSYIVLGDQDFINSAVPQARRIIDNGGYTSLGRAVGFNIKRRDTVAVGSGVTSVTVTHYMNVTPVLGAIRLMPGATCPAYWVDTITATTFVIHFASATAAAFTMGYAIDMGY